MAIRKREWGDGRVAWMVDLEVRGRRHRRQFPTQREAKAYELEVRARLKAGTFRADGTRITLLDIRDDYFRYLDDRHNKGKRMTRSHLKHTVAFVNNYIIGDAPFGRHKKDKVFRDGIGQIKLPEITPAVVEEFFDSLLEFGLSRKSAREVKNALSGMLSYAIRKNFIAINNAKALRMTEGRNAKSKRKVEVPTKLLVRKMLATASGMFRTYLMFAAFTGLGAGEQRALVWGDIDFKNRIVKVRRRLDRWGDDDGQGAKTDAGNRDVPLAPELADELTRWRESSQVPEAHNFVFPSRVGGPVCHDNLRNRYYYGLYRDLVSVWAHEEPVPARPRWHDLRHFAISCWIEEGLPPKAIQKYAGHTLLSTTMDIYGHLFPDDRHNDAMSRIARSLLDEGD